MPNLRWQELLIIVALVLLLFGAKRLPDAARGLGRSLRIFKAETKGLVDGEAEEASADAPGDTSAQAPAPPSAIQSPPRDASSADSKPVEHDSGERSTETNNG
jgi:sec-independent protein translocase protein TatA